MKALVCEVNFFFNIKLHKILYKILKKIVNNLLHYIHIVNLSIYIIIIYNTNFIILTSEFLFIFCKKVKTRLN
jgi:hypothetical protein